MCVRERRSQTGGGTGERLQTKESVEAAARWADHCNKCCRLAFNSIVKSFNHNIKNSYHLGVTALLR